MGQVFPCEETGNGDDSVYSIPVGVQLGAGFSDQYISVYLEQCWNNWSTKS